MGEAQPFVLGDGAYSFTYEKVLGEGKFGTTYRGVDKANTTIAVKQFMYKSCKQDHFRKFCDDRINKGGKTEHPNLLRYFSYCFINDDGYKNDYLVAEYCNKGNLLQYVESITDIQLTEKLHMMIQCAEGLNALHSMTPPNLHGFIKPENILVTNIDEGQNTVKLGDYYSSMLFQREHQYSAYSDTHTSGGHNWNDNDYYKAPEAFPSAQHGAKVVIKKSESYDVFSLGCIFYGLLEMEEPSAAKWPPYVKGQRKNPIGYVLCKKPKTELFERSASGSNGMQIEIESIIKKMLSFQQNDRLKASEVVTSLKHLEGGPKPVEDKATGIFRKFYKILKENGALKPTDERLIVPFSMLEQEEIRIVMAKGSIPDFLTGFDGIKKKEDKLFAVESPDSKDLQSSETVPENTCQTHSSDRTTQKCQSTNVNDNDALEKSYQIFLEKLKNDKQVCLQTYPSSKDQTIFISLEKQNEGFVKEHMKKNYPDYKFEYFQDDDGFEWLMMNCTDDVFIDQTIGPGSFFMVDQNLQFLRNNSANKMLTDVKDFVSNNTPWGTLGCFAQCPNQKKVYAVSVKHIINKVFGSQSDRNIQMISGFEQNHNITVQHHLQRNESLSIQAKDFVYVTKGYSGILDSKEGKFVDIALYGPLTSSMVKNHDRFEGKNKHMMQIVPCDNMVGRKVMKYGAKTGFQRGIVLVVNAEACLASNDRENQTRNGTFVVTSLNNNQQPDEDGNFASLGDSGSIVLLDDENVLTGIGIVFQLKKLFLYTDPETGTKSVLRNVSVCVCLDHAVKMLGEFLQWRPQLYYYHFQPRLCLGDQNDDDGTPPPTSFCPTSVANEENDNPLCSGVKHSNVEDQ